MGRAEIRRVLPGRFQGILVPAGGLDVEVGPLLLQGCRPWPGSTFVKGRKGRFAAVQAHDDDVGSQGSFHKSRLAGPIEKLGLGATVDRYLAAVPARNRFTPSLSEGISMAVAEK